MYASEVAQRHFSAAVDEAERLASGTKPFAAPCSVS
ncbi:hypothetical protein FBZ96_11337 [Bradyrhizobium stylosanthis]|uniref:Uncharacterized protein n=1 Tax=Bradyrhizobium stylosanthis TaxID=1803665 RepID=A0A560D2J4_9BRAD|nr:hypothetical protein FBZ96_11337 [Bradyrhizobium stylosanthis]